jgi:hypothetical protein
MPIRVENEPDSARDTESLERDECVADFVISVGMPMAAIQPTESGKFRLTYSLEDMGDNELDADDTAGWAKCMRGFAEHAVNVTRQGMEIPA